MCSQHWNFSYGIPFNAIKSPKKALVTKAINIISKITNTCQLIEPKTSLLDDYKRDIERECAPFSETWLTQGNSVVTSHGWKNIKTKPLINVIASNSRGFMFLEAKDFV